MKNYSEGFPPSYLPIKKSIKQAKQRILEALNAIEDDGYECTIQVNKENEKIFREALQLFEVKVKIKPQKTSVDLLLSTPETMRLMIEFRVLFLSLLIATEHLKQITNMPQEAWLKTIANSAIDLIKEENDQAASSMPMLKLIGIDEADFVKALSR